MTAELIPFGKYKGLPIEQLQADPQYTDWLLAQPWFEQRYGGIRTIIINNFKEASDSPEHNAMQARFLDKAFAFSVASSFMKLTPFDKWKERVDARLSTHENPKFHPANIGVEFEVKGWDVVVSMHSLASWTINGEEANIYDNYLSPGKYSRDVFWGGDCCIELKPSIGEDFPNVLRQVKSRNYGSNKNVLVESFQANSVSLEQVQEMFLTSGIHLLQLSDIKTLELPEVFLGNKS